MTSGGSSSGSTTSPTLGANVIFLTPIFPGGSTHRYDATTFDAVDPLLGGDDALVSLVGAAHARGIKLLGDLTTNHVGVGHDWFAAARNGSDAPEREFFFFDDRLDHGYASWHDVPSLPKLDHSSGELRDRFFGNDASVAGKWLRASVLARRLADRRRQPDRTARGHRSTGGSRERRALGGRRSASPEALVVAEHSHDARGDLQPGSWHGTMSYAGFTRPAWAWLRGDAPAGEPAEQFLGLPTPVPRLPGTAVVKTMRRFRAGIPWPSVLHSWVLLDSHDTARFRTIAGSRERQLVGVGLQMTTPGVPMVFAGDELGLEGGWGEDARRTMPWARPETWDSRAARRATGGSPRCADRPRARSRWHPVCPRLRRCDRVPPRGRRRDDPLPGRACALTSLYACR